MKFMDTIPMWKMPDDERIPHTHHFIMRFWAESLPNCWQINLMEQYDWAIENGIEVEHSPIQIGENKKRTSIMFRFWTEIDAMAFKLRWAE